MEAEVHDGDSYAATPVRLYRGFWSWSYLVDYAFILLAVGLALPLWKYVHPLPMHFYETDPAINWPYRDPSFSDAVVLVLIFVPVPVFLLVAQL